VPPTPTMMPGNQIKQFNFSEENTNENKIWSDLQEEAKNSGYAGLDLEGFKVIMQRVKNQAPTPLAKGKSRTKNFSFEEKDLTPIIAET
jgi:hypothetical protein